MPSVLPGSILRFADFELDCGRFELRRSGQSLRIERKPMELLILLATREGRLVTRTEIAERLWSSEVFVDTEHGINTAIRKLRYLLRDDPDQARFIQTVTGMGYRFLCPVEVLQATPVHAEANAGQPAGPTGGPIAETSALIENPITGETDAKTGQPSETTRWKSRKWLLHGFGIALLLILAAVFVSHYEELRLHRPSLVKAKTVSGRAQTFELTNVRGYVHSPVFSPDGKQIAFFWNGKDQNRFDIYVQMVGGEQPLRLTYSGVRHICCMDWSPDGRWISFARCDGDVGGIFTVPVLGGAERKLTDVTCMEFNLGNPTWTLDGKSMLLGDRCVPDGPYGILVFSLATGQKHCLVAPPSNNAQDWGWTLSPDGRTVAFLQNTTPAVGDIYAVSLEGGSPRRLTSDGNPIFDLMWAADGKRIIFDSGRGGWLSDRLWQVSVEGGDIEPEAVYPHIGALSRDGQRIAYQIDAGGEPPSIWRAELSGPGGPVLAQKKVLALSVGECSPQLSSDGTKIAFTSLRSGSFEIWKSDADGSNPLQLTSLGGEHPRWSPDGKWIVFDRRPGEHSQIYVIDDEGRNLRAITDGAYENSVPSFSRDGQSIYYGSMRSGSWQMWKQNIKGGGPVQITRHGGFTAFESYDGKNLYYSKRDGEGLWSIPIDGGAETLVTAAPRLYDFGAWAVTETGLYLLDGDFLPRPTIEFYDFKTRKLTPIIQVEKWCYQTDRSLDASRDGRIMLYVQCQEQNALAIVDNFQ